VQVNLATGAAYRERLVGTTLYMDIVGGAAKETPIPIVEERPRGPSKVATRAKASKKTLKSTRMALSKKAVSKPAKAPKSKREPARAEVDEGDELMRELGLSSEPLAVARPAEVPPVEQAPKESPIGSLEPAPASESEEPLDLDKMFGADGGSASAGPPPSLEPPTEVAALPPPSAEKFDASKITANLPALSNLIITSDNGATVLTVEREAKTKFMIFRMRNPDRIVVDFKDSVSRLQREYAGVPGTKIQRVTTQQFAGKEGTISRVMLYVDGKPDYKQETRGTSFVLMIP
jgi:hypothetical protein